MSEKQADGPRFVPVIMTPEQAGWMLGWCPPGKSTAHVAAAIVSNKFGFEVKGKFRDNWLSLDICGDHVDFADEIVKFASAFCYDGERVFERVIVNVSWFRDSGVMS